MMEISDTLIIKVESQMSEYLINNGLSDSITEIIS